MTSVMTDVSFYASIITGIAVFISSATVIIQATTKFNPLIGVRKWFNEPVETQIKALDIKNTTEHQGLINITDNHTIQLQSILAQRLKNDVCNKDLPMKERVEAGEKYINELHLNGDIKLRHKINMEQYERDLKSKGGKK